MRGLSTRVILNHNHFEDSVENEMDLGHWRPMLFWPDFALRRLLNTTYRHRCGASGLSGAINLEKSHAQVTENHVDCHFCFG